MRISWKIVAAGIIIGTLACHPALASTAGGGLPWDTGLTTLKTDITGPVAFTLALLGMVAAGAAIIFGAELNHFIRSMCLTVMVASFIVGVVNFAAALGITGAVV